MALRSQHAFRPAALSARPLTRPQRVLLARNPRHLITCALMDPWSTLGVSKTADEKEIKKAHRKLVLQHHPDVKGGGDCVAYARFMHIQEAYELIMGKRQGKDIDNRPADKSGWQFHDWYWKFSMRRRKGGVKATAAADEEEASPCTMRQQWQAQMAGLKQKAAAKRSRQQQGRRGAGVGAAAAAAASSGGPSTSPAAREGVWRSMTKNARNADKAAAQQAAAQTLAGQRQATAVASAEGQQPQPLHSTVAAAAAPTAAPEAAPLHHAASSSPQPQQEAQAPQEVEPQGVEASGEQHSGAGHPHIERLRQLLEHAATLVRASAGGAAQSATAQSANLEQPEAESHQSHSSHQRGASPSWRHVSGRMSLEQLTALLNGQHHVRSEAGEQHPLASHPVGASSAVPADELLRERFEVSMRRHRSGQRQPLKAEQVPVPAGGPPAGSEAVSDEELRQQLREQYSQRRSTPHTAKFANRDEVEGRLSSQLAGLKRRAALKQEVETSC